MFSLSTTTKTSAAAALWLLLETVCVLVPEPPCSMKWFLMAAAVAGTSAFVPSRDTRSSARLAAAEEQPESTAQSDPESQLAQQQQQAQLLRQEIAQLRREIDTRQQAKLLKKQANVDAWIDDLLVRHSDGNIEWLNIPEQVLERLEDGRYSAEQVFEIFDRLSDLRFESRTQASERMHLLVDACGALDCWDDRANKRWNGRVERGLRKRLFARDWGMEWEDDKDRR